MTLLCLAWRPETTWTGDPRPGGHPGLRRCLVRVPCPHCWEAGHYMERTVSQWPGELPVIRWIRVVCPVCRGARKVEVAA